MFSPQLSVLDRELEQRWHDRRGRCTALRRGCTDSSLCTRPDQGQLKQQRPAQGRPLATQLRSLGLEVNRETHLDDPWRKGDSTDDAKARRVADVGIRVAPDMAVEQIEEIGP